MYAGNVRGTTQTAMGRGGGPMMLNGTANHTRMRPTHSGKLYDFLSNKQFSVCFLLVFVFCYWFVVLAVGKRLGIPMWGDKTFYSYCCFRVSFNFCSGKVPEFF